MTDIIHSVFSDVAWDDVEPVRAPEEVNGAGVILDLNTPTDHIAQIARFVVNDQNDISLRGTIAYVLAIANDNPAAEPTEDLPDEVLVTASSWIGANVIRREFHQIFHKLDVDLTFRQTDVIREDRLDDLLHDNAEWYLGQADRVWGLLSTTDGAIEKMTTFRQEAAKAIIANANHRELEERHNWFTANQNVEGTSTCRLIACGGSRLDRFRVFMGTYGHDMWHYMDDVTLRKAAHMLSGGVCERYDRPANEGDPRPLNHHDADGSTDLDLYGDFVRDSANIPYRPDGPVVIENFSVGGILHNRIRIDQVIDVGQAAKDRFPGNIVGVAGLITGVQSVISMISSVASMVVIPQTDRLVQNFTTLSGKFTEPTITRRSLLALKTRLQNVVSFAYGYCQETPELRDYAGRFSSLASFANRAGDHLQRGSIFARRMREVATDPNAVEQLISTTFNSLAGVFDGIDDIHGLDVEDGDFSEVDEVRVQVYRNADQIANEVARREQAARLRVVDDDDDDVDI